MDDNVAGSFEVKEAGNSYIKVDTTNGSELVTVGQEATFSGAVNASSTVTVDGLLTANAGISADNFTVADTSGNTSVGGTLTVTSTITATAEGSRIADLTFNNGEISSATGTIDFTNENLTTTGSVTSNSVSTGAVTATSLTVSDGNITNVGDISLDTISSDASTVQVLMDDNVAGSFEDQTRS